MKEQYRETDVLCNVNIQFGVLSVPRSVDLEGTQGLNTVPMGSVLVVILSVTVMVMVTAQMNTATITNKRLYKLDDVSVMGDVLVSRKVKTNMECSAICIVVDCLGYTLTAASHCIAYSSITSITQDPGARLYHLSKKLGDSCSDDFLCTAVPNAACLNGTCDCVPPAYNDYERSCIISTLGTPCTSDEQCLSAINNTVCFNNTCQCTYGSSPVLGNTACEYAAARKGEACAMTSQCTLTNYTVCLNTTGVCGCPNQAIEDGDSCTTLQIGEPCSSSAQCLLGLNNSTCNDTCKCITNFVPSADNSMCKYDYAAGGFVIYGGRWTLFLGSDFSGSSWDIAWLYCRMIQAKMFAPKDESEWNYLKQKASSLGPSGDFYMPINNREGNLIWNNGSSALSVSFLPWADGEEGYTKMEPFSYCGYAEYILNFFTLKLELQFSLASCIKPHTTIYACEAEIN